MTAVEIARSGPFIALTEQRKWRVQWYVVAYKHHHTRLKKYVMDAFYTSRLVPIGIYFWVIPISINQFFSSRSVDVSI
jgi:hypothetical protein